MEKLPYRLTNTGIRIPNRKIKWERPLTDETPNDRLAILPSAKKDLNRPNLFSQSYNAPLQYGQSLTDNKTNNDVDWKGADCDDG